jgi:polyisoprenoid-binding protein YceI
MKAIFYSALLSLLTLPAFAAEWVMDPAHSTLTFSGQHAGKDFQGRFEGWGAAITFDPTALDKSKIIITIPVASAKTGDALYDKTLPQAEWFDSGKFPDAVFTSTLITQEGGAYKISGDLQLKDKKIPITFPATITINDKTAKAAGTITLERDAFNIGMASDPKFEWVSQNITVNFDLKATQKN